ncbi:hypothetical protein SCUCBS95973_002454 [Sporothrix curviconia]|uniref:Mitochondrial carrier protein n=1 Tax=Sporothrix curviconia TaxID=1260050 RepID=A0ABP0B773_9PEZI
MSGHAPEGRAAGENEGHAVRVSSREGPSDDTAPSTSLGAAEPPPPIPPTLSQSTPGSNDGDDAASSRNSQNSQNTALIPTPASSPSATASTATETSNVSSIPPGAVPAVLEPVVKPSSPSPPSHTPATHSSATHQHYHHSSPAFAERFLPQNVDPSHIISSAGPSSLPIELPAIRAETESMQSSSSSSSFPTAVSTLTSASSASSSSRPPIISANAANLRLLSPFERWTLRASESQFNALAGAIGGFSSGIFTCPLDVIKTKLQAQGGFAALQNIGAIEAAGSSSSSAAAAAVAGQNHHRLYNGLVGTARVIWRDEGARGLYRGLGPIIMGYLPTWAVWFTVYNKSKIWLNEQYHIENTFVVNFWSSVIAGASSTVVTNPIWVIKTRLMSQMPKTANGVVGGAGANPAHPTLSTPWHYNSTLDAARKMYATEGILSFYSGLTPALLGLTHVAVQFPAYEYFKTKFTGRGMGDSPGDGEAPAHWLGVLSATILSKVLASSLTYPHEVIRTRLQTQRRTAANKAAAAAGGAAATAETPRYRGVVTTFRTILREEGWRAFYAGMGTNMMRAVPAATVTMLTYEYVMRSLKQTRHDARQKLEGY